MARLGLVKAVDRYQPERANPFILRRGHRGRRAQAPPARRQLAAGCPAGPRTWPCGSAGHRRAACSSSATPPPCPSWPTTSGPAWRRSWRRSRSPRPARRRPRPAGREDGDAVLGDFVVDRRHREELEDLLVLPELIGRLPERERQIVLLRYVEELTQDEIAARMQISQMHVSRLLRRAIERMRCQLVDPSGGRRRFGSDPAGNAIPGRAETPPSHASRVPGRAPSRRLPGRLALAHSPSCHGLPHRGLRADRRHPHGRAGEPGGVDRLAVPAPVRLAGLLRGPARRPLQRPLAARPGRGVREVRRRYQGDTLVLETEYRTDDGVVRVVDFMPPRQWDPDVARVVEGSGAGADADGADHPLRLRLDRPLGAARRRGAARGRRARLGLAAHPGAGVGRELDHPGRLHRGRGRAGPFMLTWHASHRPAPRRIDLDPGPRRHRGLVGRGPAASTTRAAGRTR